MLKKNNIVLRPIKKSDLNSLNKWKNDYTIFKYLGGGYEPQSIDDQVNYIDNLIKLTDVNKRFIIEVNEEAIGLVGLYNINFRNRNCELGIYIGEKGQWGNGYGKKSCEIIHNYAFNVLGLNKIKLLVIEENLNAINMYKSLGYKIIGIYEKERFIEGEFKNLVAMEYIYRR